MQHHNRYYVTTPYVTCNTILLLQHHKSATTDLDFFFVDAGCHENLNVSMYAIDSLRQLSMKFLEKVLSSNLTSGSFAIFALFFGS
jgi:Sec7-like guanine-nucleotide exchange factor